MDEETLKDIVDELDELLPGRFLGRVVQLSSFSLAIDFGLKEKGYLFISIEPAAPRLYLVKRTSRELEKASVPLSPFVQVMRTALGGGAVQSLTKDENERVVRFSFSVSDDLGYSGNPSLIAQLTGRSANLFLVDSVDKILQAWRTPHGEGQQVGDLYRPPPLQATAASGTEKRSLATALSREGAATFSAAADKYYRDLASAHEFDSLAGNLLARLRKEIARRRKLRENLRRDLVAHGNPDEHKRIGDLLLANIANAKRADNRVSLTDYYAEGAPRIELEIDQNMTLPEAASAYFSRYAKAKRAVGEIGTRLGQL
ncbi:MAG: NFACT family protein, partial [Pyrinomonadaceae bacterium]